ncbi:MAG: hypothetical protein JRE64_18090 [Deltaproteobacteria bacterium]|nr:hypothetical protein [Deltaproteobacteria bacterium]
MGIIDVGTVASRGIEAGKQGSWEDEIPIKAQLLTYMKLSGISIGLLMNFNVEYIKNGIKRMVL